MLFFTIKGELEYHINSNRRDVFDGTGRRKGSKKGFGIGLYHIKQLVEEMKGTVTIDPTYRDGFRIVVKLRK